MFVLKHICSLLSGVIIQPNIKITNLYKLCNIFNVFYYKLQKNKSNTKYSFISSLIFLNNLRFYLKQGIVFITRDSIYHIFYYIFYKRKSMSRYILHFV